MLRSLAIGPRISLGFGVVLCLLIVVGAFSSLGLWQAVNALAEYRSFVEAGDLAAELEAASLNLRLTTRDFRMTGKPELRAQFGENMAVARRLIDRTGAMSLSGLQRAKFAQAKEAIDAYGIAFDRLVELSAIKQKIQTERLSGLGPKIDEQVGKLLSEARAQGNLQLALSTAETLRSLMYGRVMVQSHEVNRNAATADRVVKQMGLFAGQLAELRPSYRSSEAVAALKEIDTLFANYTAAFTEKVAAMGAIDEVVAGPLQVQGRAIKTLAGEIRHDLSDAGIALGGKVAAEGRFTLMISLCAMLIAVSVGGGASLCIGRSIRNPIAAMTIAVQELAGGDKTVAIPGVGRKDEIGTMAVAVQVFRDNMIKADRLAAEQQAEQVNKEARTKAVEGYIKEFDQSVASILQMVSSASAELQATAQSMSATAEEASRQSTAVAAASEQASTNVQTVAAAAAELSSSIAEIGRQVSESTHITFQAVQETQRTNTQIQGLAEAAAKIGDVVKLINDIAGQTNLLALNATIEAARAGEAGKGFAVVASEVKSLANQTAKATEEISAKVTEMQSATSQSVDAVKTIGQTIGRVNEIATTIASAVEEQGAATQEIARNVQQASAGTGEVSTNIVGVTKATNDTGAAAGQVLSASGELARQAKTLRGQVDGFLAKIRAA